MGYRIVDIGLVEEKCDELRLREQELEGARGTDMEDELRAGLLLCIKELNVILEGDDPVAAVQRLIDMGL